MNNIRKYIGAAMLGGTLLAIPACTDSWDDHYNMAENNSTAATETLWELISNNPKLSRFKDIAEKATYYRDEKHPQKGYTFKNMLEGTTLMTVWAPEDDAMTDTEYQNWLNMAETNGYALQQQLMGNSISLWRHIATGGGVDTLTMLNGKKMAFDKDNCTMSDIAMIEKNIAAANGTLHTLGSSMPFRFNIYEFLKDRNNAVANNVTIFHNMILKNDTTVFYKNGSIEGAPDKNGNPTYVDSVYWTSNNLFGGTHQLPDTINNATEVCLTYDESFGDYINSEDSAYIMVMPTDVAWQAARLKLAPYYKYANTYLDNAKDDAGTSNQKREVKADTMEIFTNKNLDMDIVSPLLFNLHTQPNAGGQKGRWKMDEFLNEKGASAEYLMNTFGDTIRTDESWDKTNIFNGTVSHLSNGVAILTDEWNVPAKLYKPDLFIELGTRSFYKFEKMNVTPEYVTFLNSSAGDWIEETGKVSNNNFYYWYHSTANPKVDFKLVGNDGENRESEVMSGKYEIQLVLVPNYYVYSVGSDTIVKQFGTYASHKIVTNTGTGLQDTIPVKHKLQCTLSYCNNAGNGRDATVTSEIIDWDGTKVDTITVRFPNLDGTNKTVYNDYVEFPYSYKNLRFSYPTLSITNKSTQNERDKMGYTYDFCIDRIILRSKLD